MGFASLNPSYRLSLTQHLGESRLQTVSIAGQSTPAREKIMKPLLLALALIGAAAASAHAQSAIPDLKGTWSGKGKSIVFGSGPHHPGSQTVNDAPRVRDIEATYVVDGQDGRLVWGRSSSRPPIPRSRSPGRLPATTKQSWAPTWTAIFTSRLSHPTAWRSAWCTTGSAHPSRSSRPATRWIA